MALVKLSIVAIFLCIFTFSKIVPTIANTAGNADEVLRLVEPNEKWYTTLRFDYERNQTAERPGEFECTQRTVKISKINETALSLKIEDEEFDCNFRHFVNHDRVTFSLKCPAKNGEEKHVTAEFYSTGEKRITFTSGKNFEQIAVSAGWKKSWWEFVTMDNPGYDLTKNINC